MAIKVGALSEHGISQSEALSFQREGNIGGEH